MGRKVANDWVSNFKDEMYCDNSSIEDEPKFANPFELG